MSELAIYGGPVTIEPGEIKPWPPVNEEDERLVLDALHAEKQAYGPHNQALQEEFAAWNGIYENAARVKVGVSFFGGNQARGKHLSALGAHEKLLASGS